MKPLQRWYLPRQSLKSFLQKWLKENSVDHLDHVFVGQRHLERIFHYRLGGSVAQIFADGDQHFLNFQQRQSQGSYFQLSKPPDLSSQNMCFTFDSKTDISALIEKLKAAGSKRICLQQSPTWPPEATQKLTSSLTEAGFEIFSSDLLHIHQSEVEDADRWQENLLNASLAGSFKELKDELIESFEGVAAPEKILLLNADLSWSPFDLRNVTSSSLAMENLFIQDFESLRKESVSFLHFGLENFSLIQGPQQIWQNPWGPVGLKTSRRDSLRLQPTQMMLLNKYNEIEADTKELSFEPGPLSLGRGHTVCVFDLLSLAKKETESWQAPGYETKLIKNLLAFSRNSKNKIDEHHLIEKITDLLLRQLLNEVILKAENHSIVLYGYFAELLKRFDLDSDRFHIVSENERSKSYMLANWGLQSHV